MPCERQEHGEVMDPDGCQRERPCIGHPDITVDESEMQAGIHTISS